MGEIKKRKRKTSILEVLQLAAPVIGVIGLFVLYIGLSDSINTIRARSWTPTNGTIISSELKVTKHQGTRGTQKTSGSPSYTQYDVLLAYRYEVGQRSYVGHRYSVPVKVIGYKDPDLAKTRQKSFPVGTKVTVFFNPQDPEQSIIHQATMVNRIFQVVIGASLLSITTAIAFFSFKSGNSVSRRRHRR